MLTEAVAEYVALRRAAGFCFNTEAAQLKSFAEYSEAKREHRVRAQIAIEWAGLAPSVPQRARRLGVIIRFGRHLHAEDERHEIPPPYFGAERRSRRVPYVLSQEQVAQLVDAASQAGYRSLRRATYSTLFALLAWTGLRVSEAIRLRLQDITPDGLLIRESKFRKSRLVPLHQSARVGLDLYLQQRCPYAPEDEHVFVSLRRKPLLLSDVASAFRVAACAIGLPDRPRARPTPHSLRHTFAVRALQTCPDGRDAITEHMMALSTYLGHANITSTYWYLEAVPELLVDIAERSERFMMGGQE